MRKQKLNTLWSVLHHLTVVLCGLVLPREILIHYGSEMNGVLHSISQFLSYAVLLELGIGAVIPAALYRPLAEHDNSRISAIMSSGSKVYRRIALVFTVYLGLLAWLFPALSGISNVTFLILVLGFGTIASYTAGTPERLLIISDQKGYVFYALTTAATLVSTVLQVILIRADFSLTRVKLAATAVNVLQIALILIYVKKHYKIDRKIKYTEEPIPQKWNGIAQHIAYFILENTDIILLTLFAGFKQVSVYAVYFMVINGVRGVFSAAAYSIQPKLGELKARGDGEALNRFFGVCEKYIHLAAAFAFGLVGLIIVPFVQAYTHTVTDMNYTRPLFAILMIVAYGIQSVRDLYDKVILASGHFKQTQRSYIIAACLNFGISIVAVQFWGLEGVAAGTLIAMAYQMLYMVWYDTKVLLKRSGWIFLRLVVTDAVLVAAMVLLFKLISPPVLDWFQWFFKMF